MKRCWLECRCCCTGNHGGHSGCTCTTSAGSTGLCDNTHHGLFPFWGCENNTSRLWGSNCSCWRNSMYVC
jgi:hypothetical protein